MAKIPTYGNEAAFPRPAVKKLGLNEERDTLLPAQWGLSKREHFAAMAMQGILAGNWQDKYQQDDLAEAAVTMADALLQRLSSNGI